MGKWEDCLSTHLYNIYLGTRGLGFYFSENPGGSNWVLLFQIKLMHFSAVDSRLHNKLGVFRLCRPLTVVTTSLVPRPFMEKEREGAGK